MKTNKSVAKRFKVTKTWKLMHSKTCRSHLLVKKWRATKKNKHWQEIDKVEVRKIKYMIPYKLR